MPNPLAAGYATGFASGFASGFTIAPLSAFPVASGLVASILARKVTTYQTVYVTPFATPFGGFFSYAGPIVLPTTLDQVLAQVAATISGAGVVTPARAFVSLEAEPFPAAGGPQAVITPGDFTARDGHQVGMGRNLATEDGSFTVHVADLNAQDQGGRDAIRLTGPPTSSGALNLLAVVHQIKNLLSGQFVQDAGGNQLSIEPVQFRNQARPRRYAVDPTWAGVDLTFSLSYIAQMTNDATTLMGGS